MSPRIKILLGVLALGALVSVWQIGGLFSGDGAAPQNLTGNISDAALATPADKDRDGLADTDEYVWGTDATNPDTDGDGFSDGEEVLSGHNPRKAGPDDKLAPQANITKDTLQLVAGSIADGSLKNGSQVASKAADTIANTIAEKYNANAAFVPVTPLPTPDSPAAREKYIATLKEAVPNILQESTNEIIVLLRSIGSVNITRIDALTNNADAVKKLVQDIDANLARLDARIKTMAAVPVPPPLAPAQALGIRYLQMIRSQYLMLRDIKDDPVQGLVAINNLIVLAADTSVDIALGITQTLAAAARQTP